MYFSPVPLASCDCDMKMQKSVSVVPLLLLLCLSGVRVTKGQGVEVTKAKSVDFKTEFEVKTPADGKADGQTDLWAELRDMVVEQRVEKREAVTQSQLEDSKTQNSGLQAQSVSPPAEYSVRLVNGTTSCSGTVEVLYEGEWLSKCYGWWSMMREVKILCRELNCGDVVAESRGPQFETGRGIVTIYSTCSGDESSIGQCVIDGARGVCNRGYYHHVTCSESVRLVDGAGLCSGRVEVKSNQSWASVCEADFDRQDAEVVCREFGCGAPAALQGGLYGEGEGQTWDKEFQCKGNECLLLDCDTSDRENNTCLPGNAVGLTCSEPDDVRLVGGGSRCAGGVEWYDQGEWRTVGSFSDMMSTAVVVCRQMGCGSPVSVLPGKNTRGFRFDCEGDESAQRGCIRRYDLRHGLTVICSDLLVQPDISLTDSMGGVFRGHQGPGVFRGYSFNITCSTQTQYPGGSFLLTFTGSNRTQTQPAVNHSAAFLFPAADDSHQGNYSCVYENSVFSHNFSSESELLPLTITGLSSQ
uniref:CD5 antigen-like n=1 Tax=Oncorhynchus gorbuscha TaxID=8017 RepID=UPI001EAF3DBF|nr:CD5 antigen-like [Oncorhynchus gorbuscha]